MANTSKQKVKVAPDAGRGHLDALTADQKEVLMDWMEEKPRPSYPAVAGRVQAEFGISVKPWEVWHFVDRHLLARRLARSLASASSLASISPAQRTRLRQSMKDRANLQADAILDEQLANKNPAHLANELKALRGVIDSCERMDLAREAHELNVRTANLREQDIVLRVREQDRKDELLKLEIQKHEDTKERTRKALLEANKDGGLSADWMAKIEDHLTGL